MSLERKIETIEGEMGVMKGEIKQTLVDLREFIMRQGSPFASGEAGPVGGVPHSDLQRLLREARESAREEATAGIRGEVETIRREAEALRAEDLAVAAAPAEPPAPQLPPARPTAPAPQPALEETAAPARQTPAEHGPGADRPRVVRIQQTAAETPTGGSVRQPDGQESQPETGGQESGRVTASSATAEPAYAEQNATPFGPLDANLLTNLMRWVGSVKRRLGASQLPGFLEMYKLTGHLPPVMEKLILHLAELDALPDESYDQIFTLDDLMDSLLQLHAIVYGPGYASRGALLNLEDAAAHGTAEAVEAEDLGESG